MVEPPSRAALRTARRVVVKAGTSIVTNSDGRPSLTRLGAITEQIAELVRLGKQVIFVSSGAVGMGKQLLRKQARMNMSLRELQHASHLLYITEEASGGGSTPSSLLQALSTPAATATTSTTTTPKERKKQYDSACAAAGQFEMMNLYSTLFGQCEVSASQILVTQSDFTDGARLRNLQYAMERLLSLGIVPILNENDAVSANMGYTAEDVFSDNDSLAAICARHFDAEVLLLLTDVQGVYDRPPSECPDAKRLSFYPCDQTLDITIGEKSLQGRGGMGAKIDAALNAVKPGTSCIGCIIASGTDLNCIRAVLHPVYDPEYGPPKGTLFVTPDTSLYHQATLELSTTESLSKASVNSDSASKESSSGKSIQEEARTMATLARMEARKLLKLSYSQRQSVICAIADALLANKEALLEANLKDLNMAGENNVAKPLVQRLKLTEEKLATLAKGIRSIALQKDPLGVLKSHRELSPGLILSQITVPIGVLMIIFESRPDSLPQISALALASGNGLILKGGKEAYHSNQALHSVIGSAIEASTDGFISRHIIGLVTTRGQVSDMLGLDDVIDLVIPRGSNELVTYIKENTRIPVLGHADGVCHVYVAPSANVRDACKVVVDAKTDYPSACNSMETLLFHRDTVVNASHDETNSISSNIATSVLMSLRAAGVKCYGGTNAMKYGLCDTPAEKLKCEYGDMMCTVEVVNNTDEAIEWIHQYGSGHTEVIVCSEDDPEGEYFLKSVDAACVFQNASSRFADGYRFGLGAGK